MARPAPAAADEARRTWSVAAMDALPDTLALGACLLAWFAPAAVRIDLIAWAAPLYFVEFPLALLALFGGVTRLEDREMNRRTKLSFVVAPILLVALLAPLVLGPGGFVAVIALSARLLWRAATGAIDRSPRVRGAWITYAEGDDVDREHSALRISVARKRRADERRGRTWRVGASHELVMAAFTLTFCVVIAVAFQFMSIPQGGITAEIAAASLWSRTVIGSAVGAHAALAAGAALFAARIIGHTEGVEAADAPPPPTVEDDPVLREIVEKVEGRKPQQSGPRRK